MILSDDLLTGASAIAAYIGWSRSSIYHMERKGCLPIMRVGGLLVARKSELERAFSVDATRARQEQKSANENNV
jgi:predicted DNA-binding transcriptional regulator AlpA